MSIEKPKTNLSYWMYTLEASLADHENVKQSISSKLENNHLFTSVLNALRKRLAAIHPSFYLEIDERENICLMGKYLDVRIKFKGVLFLTLHLATEFDPILYSESYQHFIINANGLDGLERRLLYEATEMGRSLGIKNIEDPAIK